MRVLILAGGYGTRLYPIIVDTPKVLLQVCGRPLVDYLLDKVREFRELQEILVVTNNKFYSQMQDWAAAKKDFPFPIKIVNDGTTSPENRLGSVGDIDFVIKQCAVEDDLLVLGGDNLFDYSLAPAVEFARAKSPRATVGLYDIGSKEAAKIFGVVAMDKSGKVTSFEEKPANPKSSLIAMCFYYLPKITLGFVDEYLKATGKADKAGEYIRWLAEEKGVYGFQFRGKWYDIGSVEAYNEAQKSFGREKC